MPQSVEPIPKPVPMTALPKPEVPEHVRPPAPSSVGIAVGDIGTPGSLELAVLIKRTYSWISGRRPVLAEEQIPLFLKNVPHDEIADGPGKGAKGSYKEVPENIVRRPGVDVVIRAHARPAAPSAQTRVSVTIQNRVHGADVFGRRVLAVESGRVRFSEPEKFESMPLRYELAYGGVDRRFQSRVAASIAKEMTPDQVRRCSAVCQDMLDGAPPSGYARNLVGRGYAVLNEPSLYDGLELPHIELPSDRLRPDRCFAGDARKWHTLPIPAGFDFMDVAMFPRTAMTGFPPVLEGDADAVAEVAMGQVPKGYCRGNILLVRPEQIPDLIHPHLASCAPIGLRFAELRDDEAIELRGMDASPDPLRVALPGERPAVKVLAEGKERTIEGSLQQVFVDVDARTLSVIWAAWTPILRRPTFEQQQVILASVKHGMMSNAGRRN